MHAIIKVLLQFFGVSCFINNALSSKPHIIVIIADDVGWNDVSFHGSDQISTPNIDALGYHGLFLNRHYSYEVCTPSRAAFLTGKYPLRFGYQGYPLDPGLLNFVPNNLATLPKALKTLGYQNHLVGKWHLGYSKKSHTPLGYGYDTHYGYWNGYIGYFDHSISTLSVFNGTDLHDQTVPVTDKAGAYATDLFTNRALEIISNHSVEEPLFMVMAHLAGHTGKTVNSESVLEVQNMTYTNTKYSYINGTERRMYAEIVERMDDSVGQLIEALNNKQMLNNSIIVVFSDNGAPTYGLNANSGSNYPLRGLKMTMYEGAIRTPAVLFSPLLQQRSTILNSLFHITDWVPTLYAAAGGNPTDLGLLDGINQWNYLLSNGLQQQNPRNAFLVDIDDTFGDAAYIGNNGRYKLIQHSAFYYNYSGQTGFTASSEHIDKVLNSQTNQNIITLNGYQNLNGSIIEGTRNQMILQCGNVSANVRNNIQPCQGVCLYDLWSDPCEYYDIAAYHPDIVLNYMAKIQEYHLITVPKPPPIFDIRSDPRRCNNTWFNWLDTDGCWFDQPH